MRCRPFLHRRRRRSVTSSRRRQLSELIAEIWQEVLGIERVSADANFFDVGGHSLLAMKVLARIEARFGVRLGPRVLMLDTLAQIAARCDRQLLAAEGDPGAAPMAAGTLAPA